MTKTGDTKSAQRKLALRARRALPEDERRDASSTICERALRLPCWQRAKCIAVYIPAAEEVDTWSLIERGWRMKRRIFAPRVRKNGQMQFREFSARSRLSENRFGILEPLEGEVIAPRRLDVVFAPLVAFDTRCERIGWGGGYYDRTFAFANLRHFLARPKLIGLAFACQRVDRVADSSLDVSLFQVVTESTNYTRS